MWHCRMTAMAGDCQVKMISTGHTGAIMHSNMTFWQTRPIMHTPDRLHLACCEQPVINHGLTTRTAFFGRLENEIDCAVKITGLRQMARCPQQHGHMAIMTTGMHSVFYL